MLQLFEQISTKNVGYSTNIEKATLKNTNFRKILFTTDFSQVGLMSVQPGEDLGKEVHDNPPGDQFIRIESGQAKAILNGQVTHLKEGDILVIPARTEHNVINTSSTELLKLYTVYSPPQHKAEGVVHKTKADAEADKTDIPVGRK